MAATSSAARFVVYVLVVVVVFDSCLQVVDAHKRFETHSLSPKSFVASKHRHRPHRHAPPSSSTTTATTPSLFGFDALKLKSLFANRVAGGDGGELGAHNNHQQQHARSVFNNDDDANNNNNNNNNNSDGNARMKEMLSKLMQAAAQHKLLDNNNINNNNVNNNNDKPSHHPNNLFAHEKQQHHHQQDQDQDQELEQQHHRSRHEVRKMRVPVVDFEQPSHPEEHTVPLVDEWRGEQSEGMELVPLAVDELDNPHFRVDVDVANNAHPFVVKKFSVTRRSASRIYLEAVLQPSGSPFTVKMFHQQKEKEVLKDVYTEIETHLHATPITIEADVGLTTDEDHPELSTLVIHVTGLNLRLLRFDQYGWEYPILFTLFGVQGLDLTFTRTGVKRSEKVVAFMRRLGLRYSWKNNDQEPIRLAAPNSISYDPENLAKPHSRIELTLTRDSWSLMSPRNIKGSYLLGFIYKHFQLHGVKSVRREAEPKKADTKFYGRSILFIRRESELFEDMRKAAMELGPEVTVDLDAKLQRLGNNAHPEDTQDAPSEATDFFNIGHFLHGLLFLCDLISTPDSLIGTFHSYLAPFQPSVDYITTFTSPALSVLLKPTIAIDVDVGKRTQYALLRTAKPEPWKLKVRATKDLSSEDKPLKQDEYPAVLSLPSALDYSIAKLGGPTPVVTFSLKYTDAGETALPALITYVSSKSIVNLEAQQKSRAISLTKFDSKLAPPIPKTATYDATLKNLNADLGYGLKDHVLEGKLELLPSIAFSIGPLEMKCLPTTSDHTPTLHLMAGDTGQQRVKLSSQGHELLDLNLDFKRGESVVNAAIVGLGVDLLVQYTPYGVEAVITYPLQADVTMGGIVYSLGSRDPELPQWTYSLADNGLMSGTFVIPKQIKSRSTSSTSPTVGLTVDMSPAMELTLDRFSFSKPRGSLVCPSSISYSDRTALTHFRLYTSTANPLVNDVTADDAVFSQLLLHLDVDGYAGSTRLPSNLFLVLGNTMLQSREVAEEFESEKLVVLSANLQTVVMYVDDSTLHKQTHIKCDITTTADYTINMLNLLIDQNPRAATPFRDDPTRLVKRIVDRRTKDRHDNLQTIRIEATNGITLKSDYVMESGLLMLDLLHGDLDEFDFALTVNAYRIAFTHFKFHMSKLLSVDYDQSEFFRLELGKGTTLKTTINVGMGMHPELTVNFPEKMSIVATKGDTRQVVFNTGGMEITVSTFAIFRIKFPDIITIVNSNVEGCVNNEDIAITGWFHYFVVKFLEFYFRQAIKDLGGRIHVKRIICHKLKTLTELIIPVEPAHT